MMEKLKVMHLHLGLMKVTHLHLNPALKIRTENCFCACTVYILLCCFCIVSLTVVFCMYPKTSSCYDNTGS